MTPHSDSSAGSSTPDDSTDRTGGWRAKTGCLLLLLLLAGGVGWALFNPARRQEIWLRQASEAVERGQLQAGDEWAQRVLGVSPDSAEALLIAGRAAAEAGRHEQAVKYYLRVPSDAYPHSTQAAELAAEIQLQELDQLSAAEQSLRSALSAEPLSVSANDQLAYVLVVEGRRWEAAPHMLQLIKQDRFKFDHLLWLGVTDSQVGSETDLERARRAAPEDPGPVLGLARLAQFRGRSEDARRMLTEVVEMRPQWAEAQARLGHALLDAGDEAALERWRQQLPEASDEHPEIWVVRGLWARRQGNDPPAARCFWEALRRDPNHHLANYQLSQALIALGEPQRAAPFLQRAEDLIQFGGVLHALHAARDDVSQMREAARLAERLGRLWEAKAWCLLAQRTDSSQGWAAEMSRRLDQRLTADTGQTVVSSQPTGLVDLSGFPFHESLATSTPAADSAAGEQRPGIRFQDLAREAGLVFRYENGRDQRQPGTRMYEFTGGGVAVLDYDGDGWPDIYLTQGTRWPPSPDRPQLDRLFRNLGGRRFEDVTERALLHENGFSQGVAAGDIDNDGWPDLYVANIGRNRLLHNNGDGTFSDITDQAGIEDEQWTTSCLIADLDRDGWPDIYDVNYLGGDDVFTRTCQPRICQPRIFPAAQDRLLMATGDGRFADRTGQRGVVKPEGRGLGIVAADFDGSGRLSLFVANDQVSNFFFHNEPGERPGEWKFVESALLRGVAVDWQGHPQACMGVAAEDADNDGQLDLFITNFANEANTLYVQQDGAFVDQTRRAGLHHASHRWLGFGTQFLDADLDGLPDLVLVNGHLEDQAEQGAPYQMPPQLFRNLGGGRFAEQPAEQLGPYFEGRHVGRALARLDWNGDGREDFVVSDLEGAAALLTNQTPRAGHFLALRLIGTTGDRDAIGATASVQVGQQVWVRQLTAGDGYQASNQRQLVFGLGEHQQIDKLTIRWPSGQQQQWPQLDADQRLLIVEGDESLRVLP